MDDAGDFKQDDSFSMKMMIGGIRKRWPRVETMTTERLHELMRQTFGDSAVPTSRDTEHASSPDRASGEALDGRTLVILDARPPEEYAVSHLVAARRVDPDGLDADTVTRDLLTQQKTANRPLMVVSYCSIGYRSTKYIDRIQSELRAADPRTELYNLEGSLFKWANEGRPYMVNQQDQPTTYAHPYNALWGKLLSSSLRKTSPDSVE